METRRPHTQIIDGVRRCLWLDPEIYRTNLAFRASSGDIVQCSFPKSGTHWVQFIIQMILKGGEPITTYTEFLHNMRFIEYAKAEPWTPTLPARSYLTHVPLCPETMNEDAKYIYVARNPWDVCVSLFHMLTNMSVYRFQDGTFEEFVEAFLHGDVGYGSYFDHLASGYRLKDEPNVFFVTYEKLKADTKGTILRIARFLGDNYGNILEKNNELLEKILDWSTSERMRKIAVMDLHVLQTPKWKEHYGRVNTSCKEGYEGDSTKYGVVRKAKVGDWKEHFTTQQLSRFEEKIRDEGDNASFMQLWKGIHEEAIAMCSA